MTNPKESCKAAYKIWLEYNGKPILGKGGAEILEAIKEERSISKASKRLGMSYRYVWKYLERMKRNLKQPVIETFRGGRSGGGGAHLTSLGENLLKEYNRLKECLENILAEKDYWEAISLKISARNRLRGIVKEVEKDGVTAKVRVEVEAPSIVTALISREAVEELDIKPGDHVEAVIKATEVMISKEDPDSS